MRLQYVLMAGCLVAGRVLAAKPAFRMAKRQWLHWQAAEIWQNRAAYSGSFASGDAVAWLAAPTADLEALILFDTSDANLHKFPGWSPIGAPPEGQGKAFVFGHRDAHFRKLKDLALGDAVALETQRQAHQLEVVGIEVCAKEDLDRYLSKPRNEGRVALVTCYPFRYTGPAPQRYIVWLGRSEVSDSCESLSSRGYSIPK